MKNITFKKFISIYSLVLVALMVIFLIYVANSLIKYENNQLDNYMENFIEELKDADEDLAITGISDVKKGAFDKADASIIKGLAYLAENDSLTYQQSMESNDADSPVFDIYDGDNALLRVTLNAVDKTTRLGLLAFNIWEVKEVKLLKKEGLFNLDISVPNSYTVEVNGKKLTEADYAEPEQMAGLSELSKHVDLAYQANYLVKGLTDAPEVKITDKSGKPIECEVKGSKFAMAVESEKIADEATAKAKIKNYPNVQEIARQWSLYLSNDLQGAKNGFNTISEYLVEGTYLYKFAETWATSIDRQFTSAHGFAAEQFSDEKVCNFEIYSDKEFSCDVFLQKNMIVKGQPLADKMRERVHFVYFDSTDDGNDNPTWKLVSMKAVTEK